ncbi:MAG: phosphatase PAP2 family protein [Spirochaetes bacterium]|nr:phosphatase PAP2 family protein [Spirochaetota bacterium]
MFFGNELLFGEETLNHIHLYAGKWLDFVMVAFTQLGNEMFYILVIPFLFWCVNKRVATIVGIAFLLSAAINDIAKFLFFNPRPDPENLAIRIAELNRMYCPKNSPGFPSGHAQNAVVFWGTLAYVLKNRLFTFFSIFLIIAIAYSRLYLGVHFLGDVAGGIMIGTIIFVCTIALIPHYDKIWNIKIFTASIIFVIVPLIISITLTGNEIAKSLGVLSGFTIGFILNKDKSEEIAFSLAPSLVKFFIGLVILLLIKEGLKLIFPTSSIYDFIRYWFIGVWVSYGAPAVFARIPYLSKQLN